jgi:hypothetical protein
MVIAKCGSDVALTSRVIDQLEDRKNRKSSPMIPIPRDPEGQTRLRAEILASVTEFLDRHKGHTITHNPPANRTEPLRAVCHTCQETLTLAFEYE